MASSIITPFRWYDKYYHQDRFNIECTSLCEFKLITDQKHLLPFQLKRAISPYTIQRWILRKCCSDPERQLLSASQQRFADGWEMAEGTPWTAYTCGGISADTSVGWANAKICYDGLTIGKVYTVNFNIGEFSEGLQLPGTLDVNVYNGATLLTTKQETGYFEVTFTAGDTTVCFEFADYVATSIVVLNFVQITEAFELISGDVELDTALLNLKSYSAVGDQAAFDLISYCGAEFAAKITPGCYYSIIVDNGGSKFYSEVITVVDFIPEKSPYFKLEWYNTCDLTDVIYSGSNGCTYKNFLYLPDAVLTKPERPFEEQGEEDGNQSFKATFQKWEKQVSLIGYRLPEYIVDALTAIKLHDTIKYYYPIRKKQLTNDAAVTIVSVDYDVEYVVDDCFANVTLKMLLDSKFVDETCCHNLSLAVKVGDIEIIELNIGDPDVTPWKLSAPGSPTPTQYYIEKYNEVTEVYDIVGEFVSGVWVSDLDDSGEEIVPVGTIIIDQSAGTLADVGAWEVKEDGIFFCPSIDSVTKTTGYNWMFVGNLLTGVYGQVQHDMNGTWENIGALFTSSEIDAGVEVNIPIFTFPPVTYHVRIRSFDINGNSYGYSDQFEITQN